MLLSGSKQKYITKTKIILKDFTTKFDYYCRKINYKESDINYSKTLVIKNRKRILIIIKQIFLIIIFQ